MIDDYSQMPTFQAARSVDRMPEVVCLAPVSRRTLRSQKLATRGRVTLPVHFFLASTFYTLVFWTRGLAPWSVTLPLSLFMA